MGRVVVGHELGLPGLTAVKALFVRPIEAMRSAKFESKEGCMMVFYCSYSKLGLMQLEETTEIKGRWES